MAATSIRSATKARLVALLKAEAALSTVQVTYGWPGAQLEHEAVYVGQARGPVEYSGLSGAARKPRKDRFTIDVWFVAGAPGLTAEEAEERVEALYAAFENVVAAHAAPPLGGTVDGLGEIKPGQVDGPDSEPTDEGWVALIRAELLCLARLS